MLSKAKLALPGLVLAGFVFLSLGANGVAQAAEGLASEMEAQILALIADAAATGDTEALEEALTELVEANPGMARAIADFATKPSNLPDGLTADFIETLVTAVASAIVIGAPEMSAEVMDVLAVNQPQFTDVVASAVEDTLMLAGFETAAGGPAAGGLPPGLVTAAGRVPGFVPTLPGRGVTNTAENPAQNAASPTG